MESPNETNVEVFRAVKAFVTDLWEVFGTTKSVTPLSLYYRLITKMSPTDTQSLSKVTNGFKAFFRTNEVHILKDEMKKIPRDTIIRYGESGKVFLEIQKYVHKVSKDAETLSVIQSHLLTISTLLDPNTEKLAQLEKIQEERGKNPLGIDTTTAEGEFIMDVMETARSGFEGQEINASNPMEAMMKLYQSGVAQKLMTGIQQGTGKGGKKLNTRRLMREMKKAMDHLLPEDEDEEEETPENPEGATTQPVEDVD